jgi:hypothetical protein
MLEQIQAFFSALVSLIGDNQAASLKILAGYIALDALVTMIFPAARDGAKFDLSYAWAFAEKIIGPFLALVLLAYLTKNVDSAVFGPFYVLLYALYGADEGRKALDKVKKLFGLGPDLKVNGAIVAGDTLPSSGPTVATYTGTSAPPTTG